MPRSAHEVPTARLRRSYDPAQLGVGDTSEVEPLGGIAGQDRALAALHLGLQVAGDGFNVYAAGPPGVGKRSAVEAYVAELAAWRATPDDTCYVNDFADPYRPLVLRLPAGRGLRLRRDMEALVARVGEQVPKAFESDDYRAARADLGKDLEVQRARLLGELEEQAAERGHTIKLTPMGLLMMPVREGKPLDDDELKALPRPAQEHIEREGTALKDAIQKTLHRIRRVEQSAAERRQELEREVSLYVIGQLVDDLVARWSDLPEVRRFLERVKENMLEQIDAFKGEEPDERRPPWLPRPRSPHRDYQVNLLVDHTETRGAPVVIELNPTYPNLFGRTEREGEFGGVVTTDHTMIRAGALQRANGGYLVLQVEDLLRSPFSWDALKRALRARRVELEEPGERLGLPSLKTLQPAPIDLQLKVVLLGPPHLFHLLHALDPDFPELFKVRADFDTRLAASPENVRSFLRLLRSQADREGLLAADAPAAARLLEHSARLAYDQEKISSLFAPQCDLLREANYWARQAGESGRIRVEHVDRAIEQRIYRSSLVQEQLQELIARETLRIETDGRRVGQANGLSVAQVGDFSFGRPSRITASVGPGREGVVDIERRAELGGKVHSKGVLILSGYLLQTYGQERPLALSAALAFEQSYGEVDGDSASSAELYGLLSALADVPLAQGIAATGSIDQRGNVQAVGGVNEKVEGFFETCRLRGLTGEQGVIVPRSNLPNLMLKLEVVQAVAAGRFHVWAVDRIEQGLGLLTGMAAGERGPSGRFPEDTLHGRVERRLAAYLDAVRSAHLEQPEAPQREVAASYARRFTRERRGPPGRQEEGSR